MPEGALPPLEGFLAAPKEAAPRRWQSALRALALPEGLLAAVWTLSALATAVDADRRRGFALLLLAVLVNEAQGSTCLPLDDQAWLGRLARSLNETELPLELLKDPALAAWVTGAQGQGLLILHDARLSTRRLFESEGSLAALLLARSQAGMVPLPVPEEVLSQPVVLSAEQRQAVVQALRGPITLITGGPGTGKTSIVVAILRVALRAGLRPTDLVLAAPTGKAAHRMHGALRSALEALGGEAALGEVDLPLLSAQMAPRTLHRLLGYLPGQARFRHHQDNPLQARLVVVDEASMVDQALMERLLLALPHNARLILLGDAQQLPSVEAGTVFRDLVSGMGSAVCRLTHSYRLGSAEGAAIFSLSQKLIEANPGGLLEGPHAILLRSHVGEVMKQGVELLEVDEAGLRDFLDRWLAEDVEGLDAFQERIHHVHRLGVEGWDSADLPRLERLFAHLDRARILCPLREGPGLRGTTAINAYLHDQVLASRGSGLERRLAFSSGEPVLMTHNDYGRGIFNGDQGLMLRVQRPGGGTNLEVVFPTADGFRAFAAAPLLWFLELAYAVTVHKAQGSEFQRVALVLPTQDGPLLTREIVYTALTRARSSVTILGSLELLQKAADKPLERRGGLEARLAAGRQEA